MKKLEMLKNLEGKPPFQVDDFIDSDCYSFYIGKIISCNIISKDSIIGVDSHQRKLCKDCPHPYVYVSDLSGGRYCSLHYKWRLRHR